MLRRSFSAASLLVFFAAGSPAFAAEAATQALRFELSLYRELAKTDGNQFVSPLSIEEAFALVYAGAGRETAAELAKTFGFDASPQAAAARIQARDQILQAEGGQSFSIANGMWVERSYPLNDSYVQMIGDLGAVVEPMDFAGAPDAARTHINDWIAQATAGHISDLLSRGAVVSDTKLILANAVYFNAAWAHPFSADDTSDGVFRTATGDKLAAKLMQHKTSARYFETKTFQAAEFDYEGAAFVLDVFLPRRADGLKAFEARLDGAEMDGWLKTLSAADAREMNLVLPKVKIKASYELVPVLKILGVHAAFANAADLSGISDHGGLEVSDVAHQSFLAIDEAGTEAAAVTAITLEPAGPPPVPTDPPVSFIADHPFFLVLRHKASGTILFIGRIEQV